MKTSKTTICQLILVPATLLFLTTCHESVIRDCEGLDPISITITGSWYCSEKPGLIYPETDGNCKIIIGQDTLYNGNFNQNGIFSTGLIPNSQCGLSNVRIETNARGQSLDTTYSTFCCTDTLNYLFEDKNCEIEPITCDSINHTFSQTITTSGDCVFQNANYEDLENNVIILTSQNKLKVDVRSLKNPGGKIFVKETVPAISDDYMVLNSDKRLEIYFDVDRSELGKINPVKIELPADCIDDTGTPIKSGILTILMNAVICDPVICRCPFGGSELDFYANEKVAVNEQRAFSFVIMELGQSNFGEKCILQIDSISRANGGSAFTASNGEAWKIGMMEFPIRKKINENFRITTYLNPNSPGNYSESFVVYTSVYNENSPDMQTNEESCSVAFSLNGSACEDVCPQITVIGENAKLFDKNDNSEISIEAGTVFSFQPDMVIKEELTSRMSIVALNKLIIPASSSYGITLPDGDYCSTVRLRLTKSGIGKTDDSQYFTPQTSSINLGPGFNEADVKIIFVPPFLDDYIRSGHGNTYSCLVSITALNNVGGVICQQEVQLDVIVYGIGGIGGSIELSGMKELVILESFSQISSMSSFRSYHVYDIDEFNYIMLNYGQRQSLTSDFVTSTIPHMPIKVEHNLFADVDSTENPQINLTQKPKLYLVNTEANNFSKITASPVSSFPTHDSFVTAVMDGSLMLSIISSPNYLGDLTGMNWADHRDKTSFAPYQGLTVKPGEVYMVYDSTKVPFTFSGYRIYSGVALIYISAVKSGEDNTDPDSGGMGKGSISFYVEYPVVFKEN